MVLCPRMEVEFQGMSSQTGRIITRKNGISLLLSDASAWMIALSMSSGLYFRLAMHELVHQNWKDFIIAPKTVSSGKAEQ
jgi:hypothetical protein